ncbi:MAG TPA: DUF2214 domain-containing protein [Kiloniellaceae bacterium]
MLAEALTGLQNLEPVAALRASRWVYPLVNTLHVAGLGLLVGAILPLDLRLLGVWRSVPLHLLARVLQPVAAAGLGLAAATGLAMFAVSATKYVGTPVFLVKLLLIAAALTNALLLRRSAAWVLALVPDYLAEPPVRLKAAAALSIALWLAVILCGRFIGYLA